MIVKAKLLALKGKLFTVLWQLFPDTENGYSIYFFLLISICFLDYKTITNCSQYT